MTAQIIAITNQKGGSSKTTTAMCLSGELGNRGYRVLVVDADAQQSALSWSRAAPNDRPFPAAVVGMASYGDKLHREVQRQLENYQYIVLDFPPSLDAVTPLSGLLIANLAIVPLPPSPADLWAAQGAMALIRRLQIINGGLEAVILATKVQRTSLSQAVIREMQNFGLPLMKARLSHRTAFQEAVLAGTTVAGLGRDARTAAIEVNAMTDEVLAILEREK